MGEGVGTRSQEWRQVLKPEKVEIIIKMTRNSINKLSASLAEQQDNLKPPTPTTHPSYLPLHSVTPPTSHQEEEREGEGEEVKQ